MSKVGHDDDIEFLGDPVRPIQILDAEIRFTGFFAIAGLGADILDVQGPPEDFRGADDKRDIPQELGLWLRRSRFQFGLDRFEGASSARASCRAIFSRSVSDPKT